MRMESLFFTLKEGGNEKTESVTEGAAKPMRQCTVSAIIVLYTHVNCPLRLVSP